jgi:cytochrome c oxidase assembly protein subunit 15
VQFNHRMFAYLLFILVNAYAWLMFRKSTARLARPAALMLAAALWLQVILGISTLLLHVPVAVATAHQGCAVLLLSAMLFAGHVQLRQ